MKIDLEEHLAESLETHKMKHIKERVDAFKEKADEVKQKLQDQYGPDVYNIFQSGSFAKHTAINTKFDIDLVVPFPHDEFETLESMFDDVYSFLSNEYQEEAEVRKQKVSVGLIFQADKDGNEIKLDVVPGRELSSDDYPKTNDLNLYFNEDHWGFKKGSRQKTNIQAQIKHILGKKDERKIIRLLKIWKTRNNEDFKSFVLELFSIKAMASYDGSDQLWDKLKYVMTYIADHVTDEDFQLIDPGNSNNNVLSSMSSAERYNLADKMKLIINNIDADSNNAAYYFPINEKFQDTVENYGSKAGVSGPSYPPSGQRFGR